MADIKRKIYFTKLQFRKMLSHEEETDIGIINSVFSRYADAYYQAESSGDYSNFVVQNKNTDEIFAVTRLHFEGNVLCGIVGRYATRIKGFLRETDIKTFSTKEIEPSSPESRFEIYSYFAIVPHLLKIAYLSDTSISSNIPRMVLDILRSNNGDGIYEIELTQLVDSDIKDKLKKMEGKIRVKGWIEGQEDAIAGGMQSLRSLETVFGSKITAKIRLTAGVSKRFTNIKNRLEHFVTKVKWHIQRLYRIRNEITHSAFQSDNSLTIYIEHLYTYLSQLISEVVFYVEHKNSDSVEEAYATITDAYRTYMELLNAGHFTSGDAVIGGIIEF